ncbi:MAG TPA: SDR family oxidoreductase [Dermatophilaceae bacterium]
MILVAGGSGRLGHLVVERLVGEGRSVRVMSRNPSAATDLAQLQVEVARGDVRDPSSLGPVMSEVSTVVSAVHGLAGSDGVSPESVDRDGNRNLIDAAAAGTADVILVSVVGASPDHPMELFRMKWAAEEYLRASGLPWTIVRASAFADTWIELLRQSAGTSGRPRVFGRGDNPINFVWAQDVADAVVRATLDHDLRGQVIEVGGPDNLTFNEIARLVQASMKASGSLHHVPRPGLRAMGLVARPFNPTMARLARASLVMDTCDLTFDAQESTRAYPWLSCTPIASQGTLVQH